MNGEFYLDARIAELEAEGLEQARLLGMSSEREARHLARIAELEHQLDIRKAAIEASHGLIQQVRTLTRSNARLRLKIDRLSK